MTDFFVTAPKGTEPLLAAELRAFGVKQTKPGRGGVEFTGELEAAYRVCLWSRVANRVLMTLARFKAPTPEALYDGVARIDWSAHLAPAGSLAVDCFVRSSRITHSHFAALKVKDAVVDQFRDRFGERPSVNLERPDVRINLYLFRDEARLALDLSGESLHRRGYRDDGGLAPLKENLAAAILLRADWPWIAGHGGALVDPMCGSGTLLVEGALIAADVAPGLLGRRFGFESWLGHVPALWRRLREEAEQRRVAGLAGLPRIQGSDKDPRAIRVARRNAENAGLGEHIQLVEADLADLTVPPACPPGLLIVNPPYGERLGEQEELGPLYRALGELLRTGFSGWRAAVFTGNPSLAKALRLKPDRVFDLYNGALECRLFTYRIEADKLVERRGKGPDTAAASAAPGADPVPIAADGEGARMLLNRLRKNEKHLSRWARRNDVTCYRLYDADLPEYAVAVDVYESDGRWAVVQEYAAPAEVEAELARRRFGEALGAVAQALELAPERLVPKTRRRQRGADQYEKQGRAGRVHEVREGGLKFRVNFTDYLDTGLFLDHRITRAMVRDLATGRKCLNLFAYTGSFSVYAAAGGAAATTTVDMSATYLDWAKRNMVLNGFGGDEHDYVQADCLAWLEQAAEASDPAPRYGLIVLDPPTFSTSKRMDKAFDVQRDHIDLIRRAANLLTADGILFFSTNFRRFKLDERALTGLAIEDLSGATIPEDFRRNARIHRCWKIRRR